MRGLLLNCHDVDDAMPQVLRRCCHQLLRQSGHLLIFDSTKTLHYLSMYDPALNATCARPTEQRTKRWKKSEEIKRKRVSHTRYITILFDKKTYREHYASVLANQRTNERINDGACVRQENGYLMEIYTLHISSYESNSQSLMQREWRKNTRTHTPYTFIAHVRAEKLKWKSSRVFHSSIVEYEQSVCIFIFLSFSLFASLVAFALAAASGVGKVREKWRISRWMPGMVICYINF